MALIQNSCQNLALVGLCFGGSFGGGGGLAPGGVVGAWGSRASRVLSLMFFNVY